MLKYKILKKIVCAELHVVHSMYVDGDTTLCL